MSILAAFKSGNGTNQPANDSVPRLEEAVGLSPAQAFHGPWYGAVTRPPAEADAAPAQQINSLALPEDD